MMEWMVVTRCRPRGGGGLAVYHVEAAGAGRLTRAPVLARATVLSGDSCWGRVGGTAGAGLESVVLSQVSS